MELVRYADRPDLLERRELARRTFPEYMFHNVMGPRYWGRLYTDFPPFQLALLEGDLIVAEAHALPVAWDGTLADLPAGWDEAFERGMERGGHTVLSALAISVLPERQGEGMALQMIQALRDAARAVGLSALLAPVRPTLKERYPLIPIEDYITWRRPDGSHFDPWIRVHERAGAEVIAPAPESMTVEAPAADWEEWTGLALPADGTYVVPGMLAPLVVRAGVGRHAEPNVWLRHTA